ncbi:hypothetical protein BGX30_008752, partial [Mortierella sp. GBA39]
TADPVMAEEISINAKVQRPSVCNSMETLIVHQAYAKQHLLALAGTFKEAGVELRGDEETRRIVDWALPVTEEDYATEYNDYILNEVDAAAVYHNASTRFTDGFEFGFGAEIGISTQKLHARGPMGLPALTSTKYIIHGNGQIRG